MDHSTLKYLLFYRDGSLYWNNPASKKVKVGQLAGSSLKTGYRQITVQGKRYLEHVLVWFYFNGTKPATPIDHTNGIRSDNRIENLRLCSPVENQYNKRTQKNTTSIYKGVYYNKKANRWHVQYRKDGKKIHVGFFDTEMEAAIAYDKATLTLHKNFHKPNLL